MELNDRSRESEEQALEFDRHEKRSDGAQVVAGLTGGLTILRESLYVRLQGEVEQMFGVDSLIMPISALKTKDQADLETDLYQVAECTAAARSGAYVSGDETWFPAWLAKVRLKSRLSDAHLARVREYLLQPSDRRRLKFTDVLARVLPESRRAPLVLFRLLPLAVQVATHLAFGNLPAAEKVRQQQKIELPAIADCRKCRGKVLARDEQCPECGNPLWNTELLTATD